MAFAINHDLSVSPCGRSFVETENSVEEVGPGARVDKPLRQKGRSFVETENSVEEEGRRTREDLVCPDLRRQTHRQTHLVVRLRVIVAMFGRSLLAHRMHTE